MSAASKATPTLGFLTVVDSSELGLIGGYLLLNAAGRPLEFHCTAPVRPNRTQEILYGPTLKPYLYGEQIARSLLSKSKQTPVVVCTDCEDVLAVRECVAVPVVLVGSGEHSFALATNCVATARNYSSDEGLIRRDWPAEADHLDLLEPFARIREALDEAQRTARQAA